MVRTRQAFDRKTVAAIAVGGLLIVAAFASLAVYLTRDDGGADATGPSADAADASTDDSGKDSNGSPESDPVEDDAATDPPDADPQDGGGSAEDQSDGDGEEDEDQDEEGPAYVPPTPQVTLAASASTVLVPSSVSFTLTVQNMDADTLSWSLDLWDDGSEDDFGTGNPGGATIHTVTLDDPTQAGDMRVKVTVQDENNPGIDRAIDLDVLGPCGLAQLEVKADPFDDAASAATGASEITCYGATRIGDDLRLELPVLDKDDVDLGSGQKLRYYLYFTSQWGDADTYNRITVDYDGNDTTATWDRLNNFFIYAERPDAEFTFGWDGDKLHATVPLDDVDADGALPTDDDRMNVYAESWLQRPAGQTNSFLDFVASAAEGEDYHFIKFQGSDLVLETQPVV